MRLTAVLGLPSFWKRDPDVSVTPDELAVLAGATGVPLERLLQCSVLPMLSRLHESARPDANPRFLVMMGKHRGVHGVRGHPLCPACVRETGVVQRSWRLTTSVICRRHSLPLIDACPHCQSPLDHVRLHRRRSSRRRLMEHRPGSCPGCRQALPDPPSLDEVTRKHALFIQDLMAEATATGEVLWGDLRLDAREFQGLLESFLQLHYPTRAQTGVAKWRPETSGVRERREVVVAAGERMVDGLVACLRRLREENVRPHRVVGWASGNAGVPDWFRELVFLALSPDARHLPPVQSGRKTFQFTERQWRVIAPLIPPVPRTSRKQKGAREVLQAWCTRNLKGTRQTEWTGKWTGHVSYPAMYRGIKKLAESGVLDQVIGRMLDMPECRTALTAPGTVGALIRMRSAHAGHLWTLMVEEALRSRIVGSLPA